MTLLSGATVQNYLNHQQQQEDLDDGIVCVGKIPEVASGSVPNVLLSSFKSEFQDGLKGYDQMSFDSGPSSVCVTVPSPNGVPKEVRVEVSSHKLGHDDLCQSGLNISKASVSSGQTTKVSGCIRNLVESILFPFPKLKTKSFANGQEEDPSDDMMFARVEMVGVGAVMAFLLFYLRLVFSALLKSVIQGSKDVDKTSIQDKPSRHKNEWYYHRRRQHPGLSSFIRVLAGVILLLSDSKAGVNIVSAANNVDRVYTGAYDSTAMVENEDHNKVNSLRKHVKKITRSLRGKDPTTILAAADEGVDSQLKIMQSLIKFQEEGSTKDKASLIRSLIGGFKDFNKDMKEGNELMMNPELSKMMEAIPDLPLDHTFEMDMVADEQLVEMFTHVLGFQDLDQNIEHAKGVKDLARKVTDILSVTPGHRRQLKDDPFEFDHDQFQFGTGGEFKQFGGQGHFQPRFNFGSNSKFRDLMKKARDTARRQSQYGQRGHLHNQGDKGRRLRVNERHLQRTNSIPQCFPTCDVYNSTCNCDLLFDCVNKMSSYDVTVLMTKEYINDDGNYSSDGFIDVFDATGSAILRKLTRAQSNAKAADPTNEDRCMNVLEEFHSTCDPNTQDEVCPGGSVDYRSSFQLTVDQVCASVDTNTKLLFEPIHRVFDLNSCGIVSEQKVYVGCDTTYLSLEARQAECYGDIGCSDADCTDKDCATCCTSSNKCYAGQGNCDTDDDCQYGFVCGTDNCQKDFKWLNGNSEYDCCEAEIEGQYPDGSSFYSDTSKIIFDGWNSDGTSCGISNGQTVYTGCGFTYLVEEERNRLCCGDPNSSCGSTSTINVDGWVDPSSVTDDENCGSVSFSACAKFAETFDRLYRARDIIQYSDGNPMLIITDYIYLGCWADPNELVNPPLPRALPHQLEGKYTIQECINSCSSLGYIYAGLQFESECYCGNDDYKRYGPDTDCNCCDGLNHGGNKNCVYGPRLGHTMASSADSTVCLKTVEVPSIPTSSNLEFKKILFPKSYQFTQSTHGINVPETLEIIDAKIPGFPGKRLVDLQFSSQLNIALGKPATQSNTYQDTGSGTFSISEELPGYKKYTTGGCEGKNELGESATNSLQECATMCSDDPSCISFEYIKDGTTSSTPCHLSKTCTFDLSVTNEGDAYNLYVKLFTASNVVDGSISSFSYTNVPGIDYAGIDYWWQVDLEYSFEISSIFIVNRQDCCQENLKDFWIRLIGADGSTIVDEQYIDTAVASDSEGTTFTDWAKKRLARYVRIYMPEGAGLAEVQVNGNYRGITDAGDYCLTGQFESKVAKEAMESCDDSMALLLGDDMSLGTLINIVNKVEEKGAGYMPGTCCQDTAVTSEYFGVPFDPSIMECQYPGLWHLGLSSQACENAGGRWFRSSCVELKECINDRPKNGTDGYSQSFEDFALGLVIDDPSYEEQCQNTRKGLGFDPNYEFDVDVCEEFDKFMCDPTADGIDDITDDSDPVFNRIEYEPITYPDDPPLPFTPLTTRDPIDMVDQDQQQAIEISANALEYAQNEAEQSYELAGNVKDSDKATSDWTCKMVNGGSWIGGLAQSICYLISFIFVMLSYAGVYVSYALVVATSYSSIAVGQQVEDYAQDIYYDMFVDRAWMYTSLNTINNNINDQNTEMRDQLENEHEQMVNDINTVTVATANNMGCQIIEALEGTCNLRRRLDSDGKTAVGFETTWYSEEGEVISFMEKIHESVKAEIGFERMDRMEERIIMVGESVKAKIENVCVSKPRGKGNKKKPKSDKSGSNLFTNEDNTDEEESGNRDLMGVGYEALFKEKLDGVYDSVANVKTDVVDMKDKINAFEVDIADMKGKMDVMEGKVNAIETDVADMKGKMDTMEEKMDTIIEMMTQLLGQDKLVKE